MSNSCNFLFNFRNKVTNEIVQTDMFTVYRYIIFTNYALFCVTILTFVISIVLIIFTFYHLNLIRKGSTSVEASKRDRINKYIKMVRSTLYGLIKEKGFNISEDNKKIKDDEILKYKELMFKSRIILILDKEFDVSTLNEDEVRNFLKFLIYYEKKLTTNIYNKGFYENLKEIILK